MNDTLHAVGDPHTPVQIPPIYDVKVVLKNREELRAYCSGYPTLAGDGSWLHLSLDTSYKHNLIVNMEEIAYIKYRLRTEETDCRIKGAEE